MPAKRFKAVRHDEFDDVRALWEELERTGFVTAFQCTQWVNALLQTWEDKPGLRFCVVEIREVHTQKLLMLLPFCLVRRRGYSVIEFLSFGVCDISMPVLAREDALGGAGDEQSLWQAVVSVLPPADIVTIGQIPLEYRGRLNPLARLPGAVRAPHLRYETGIEGDAAGIVERLANNQTRRILKTSDRRMSERGTVRFLVAERPGDLDQLLPIMMKQRRERFKELGRYDLLARQDVQDFYERAARASLSGQGPVRVWALFVGNEPIATCLGLVHEKTFTLLIITMAGGQWAACSPGVALLSRIIRWAREQGLTIIDFSIGDAFYKTGLGGSPHELMELRDPQTLVGKAVLAIARLVTATKGQIKTYPALFQAFRKTIQFFRRNGGHIINLARRARQDRADILWIPLLMPLGL